MQHLIRAVLFDLDGVIVFTDRYHYLSWKRLADERGWAFDETLNHQLRGIPRSASLQVILDHNNVTLADEEKRRLADRKNAYYLELLTTMNEDDLYPGVVPFLERVRGEGILLGLCSASRNAVTVLERLDLQRHFDVVISGHDVARAKPDPEIFLLAAERLGVPPFHCIVFEDAVSGVEAALAAGMKVIGVVGPHADRSAPGGPAPAGPGAVEPASSRSAHTSAAGLLPNAPEVIRDYEEIDIQALLDCGRPAAVTPEPWTVAETRLNPRRARYWESLFALTNGFMGLRGTHEEDDPALAEHAYPGMFLNGIYDYEPFHHVVSFPGFPPHRHVMLNVCDWRIINLEIDGERFSPFSSRVADYRRELDMKRGVVVRNLTWESPDGRRVRIRTTRLVSMARRHSAVIRYEVTPLDAPVAVVLESVIRGTARSGQLKGDHLRILDAGHDDDLRWFVSRPVTADFRIGMAFAHDLRGAGAVSSELKAVDDAFIERFTIDAEPGRTVTLDKHACFHTSIESAPSMVRSQATIDLRRARTDGFDTLLSEHEAFWERYWALADIEIDGHTADQQAVRFAMFHLRQSNPEDDRRSISACGMTGDHYWGHVFWDTEMYISPHFLYTQPEIVRPLLMYRFHLLDAARRRAREMAGEGALYAWNSISGEECGVVYEASTAEYHLVSDIALAVDRYVAATGDTDFLYRYGAEMLVETARFLAGRGTFSPFRDDQFCINVVCGPDEYGCGINNNCYTNMLARWHFRQAADVCERMKSEAPEAFAALASKIGLKNEETALWRRCADRMYIPWNEKLGIHEQDDSFLYLDPVDMSRIPLHTDLRNHTHPLNLWRMQVAKQADVVLLMLVLSDQFTLEQKRANYDFYEPRTNHGSSLSTSIHSIIAAEIGRPDDAYAYFRHSAFMDLNDFKGNTAGGVHAACIGGTWMAVVHGFAGMRDDGRGLVFDPMLPAPWHAFRFKLRYRGRLIRVAVEPGRATYTLLEGDPVTLLAAGQPLHLTPADPTATAPAR